MGTAKLLTSPFWFPFWFVWKVFSFIGRTFWFVISLLLKILVVALVLFAIIVLLWW